MCIRDRIVTEHLVDLNIIREFSISHEKVYNALKWLQEHNPLYKDVEINKNVRMDVEDLVRIVEKPQQQLHEVIDKEHQDNFYKKINGVSRILRASWSQDNRDVFTSGYAGVQCCAMTLANIVRAFVYPPQNWSTNTLDMNMIEGDRIYKHIRVLTENDPAAFPINEDGYLEIRNFSVIKNDLIVYHLNFS